MTEKPTRRRAPLARAGVDLAARALSRALELGAVETVRAYRQAWARWEEWCALAGALPLPADPRLVLLHLEAMAERYAPSTIEIALAAISRIDAQSTMLEGASRPAVSEDAMIKMWRRRFRANTKAGTQHQAPALERHHMLAIVRALPLEHEHPPTRIAASRDRAVLLLGWLGCLRRSELAALAWDDVRETERGLELAIASSKNDQDGAGAVVAIHAQGSPVLCAQHAWHDWARWATVLAHGIDPAAAFTRLGPPPRLALSGAAIGEIVKRRAADVGIAATGHSLRAGFATEAALRGVSERAIGQHGRWRSAQVLRRYVRRAEAWDDNPTEGLT